MDEIDERTTALAALIGARIVREDRLPAGPGVLPSEVGEVGPWYAVQLRDGSRLGWAREAMHLRPLIRECIDDLDTEQMLLATLAQRAVIMAHVDEARQGLQCVEPLIATAEHDVDWVADEGSAARDGMRRAVEALRAIEREVCGG